jgi:hypothetical protein
MFRKIKTKLIILLYVILIVVLAFLVYEIVKEKNANQANSTQAKQIQAEIDEQKNKPKMSLTQNPEITLADCGNQCVSFKNNQEDYAYCQDFCKKPLSERVDQ